MRLEAGRLLGKQGTPLLPLGRGQLGGSGTHRGVSLKAGHTHPFHSPFIFVSRRKPLRFELETASHPICWLPHHQEKKEIGFCTLRLSLRDTSPDDAPMKAKRQFHSQAGSTTTSRRKRENQDHFPILWSLLTSWFTHRMTGRTNRSNGFRNYRSQSCFVSNDLTICLDQVN